MSVQTIDVQTLSELLKKDPSLELLDVRTPAEFETVHAVGARLQPLDRLDPKAIMASRNGQANQPLYLICKGGVRSAKAAQAFQAAGYGNVISVAGGTDAWVKAGLPINCGSRKTLPLDRQIQLTAGMICLIGVILGTFVNPWWYLACAMVGFGLSMAGLTGFCPMAIVMARMPWNRASAGASCCCSSR